MCTLTLPGYKSERYNAMSASHYYGMEGVLINKVLASSNRYYSTVVYIQYHRH